MPWFPRQHRPHDRATHHLGRAVSAWLLVVLSVVTALPPATAEQPPAPCHPNATAAQDVATVRGRDDVTALPAPLQQRLAQLADRPHSVLPLQVYAEADAPASWSSTTCWRPRGSSPTCSRPCCPASMTRSS